jgi:PST family polysaccharide transporter/lipopolysaccharide exporter
VIESTKSIIENFLKGTSLKAQAIRGGVWLGAGSGTENVLRFIRNLILVRWLAPEAFGVMALVLAINAACESFTEIGIKEAIIQSPKGRERAYLNGAWWLSCMRGTGLYFLILAVAPWFAQFYDHPELAPLIRVAALSILLKAAMSAEAHVALKQMQFKKWIFINNLGGAIGIVATILLAATIRHVWALVLGLTVEAFSRFLLSYIVCPYRPGLRFEKESWQALLKFARGVLGLPILTFIFMWIDVFVIGKLRTPAELGLYNMAATLAYTPLLFVSTLIRETAIPAFSQMQSDKAKINQGILQFTTVMAFVGIPALFFVIFYGRDLLALVYGTPYASVAVPFAIIFTSVWMSTSSTPIAAAYFSLGRPELHRLFTGIRAILTAILIYPAVKYWGLVGAAMAGFIAVSVGYSFQLMKIRQLTALDLSQYLAVFLRPAGVSLCVVLVWVSTRDLLLNPSLRIFPGLMGCLSAYSLALAIFLRSLYSASVLRARLDKSA